MDFGDAIKLLKQGKKVKRRNWGWYWFIPKSVTRNYAEMSFTFTADDILANDWELISTFYDGFGTSLAVGDYVVYTSDCSNNLHKGKISQLDYADGMYKVTLESGRFFTCTEGTFGYLAVVKKKEK